MIELLNTFDVEISARIYYDVNTVTEHNLSWRILKKGADPYGTYLQAAEVCRGHNSSFP